MKKFKNIYIWMGAAILMISGIVSTSCSDDIPSESYYTYKGQMLSDYLTDESNNCTMYGEICKRANRMDMLSSYGRYTCFAPTNDAVQHWMDSLGYASISDIPTDVCDTICRNHIVSNVISYFSDLKEVAETPTPNMLGLPITLQPKEVPSIDPSDTAHHETIRLKNAADILYYQKDDSVQNGVVHAIDAVIPTASDNILGVMQKDSTISWFYNALIATGINKKLMAYKDYDWDPEAYESKSRKIYTGAQYDYAYIPETKYYGFTVFACQNKTLKGKGYVTDEKQYMQNLYDYAESIYETGEKLDLTVNEDGTHKNPEDWEKLKDSKNALHRLIAYHCLNRKATYDKFTTFVTVENTVVNPTEWYSTMDSLTTIKVTALTVKEECDIEKVTRNVQKSTLFLNRCYKKNSKDQWKVKVRGAMVDRCENVENEGSNGYFYYIDDLVNYIKDTNGDKMENTVFNDRIRMDMYTFFPELMNNNIRATNPTTSYATDYSGDDKDCKDYLLPDGYLDNVTMNADGDFLYQNVRQNYWSYEGDEFNLCSQVNSYDIEFNLPSVPEGTYQLRLGLAVMRTRGICQFYFDGVPKGLPFDMRSQNFNTRTGWKPLYVVKQESDGGEASKKALHNQGWYHGPNSIFCRSDGNTTGAISLTDDSGLRFSNVAGSTSDNGYGTEHTVRYVLGNEPIYISPNQQHKIRIKSVWAVGTALVMMDYFELVPKAVYGIDDSANGIPEDDN